MNESEAMSRATQTVRKDLTSRMTEKDYSATPLRKKLGIKDVSRLAILGAPAHFRSLIEPLPPGVRVTTRAAGTSDVIVAFETRAKWLGKRFASLARALDPAGGLWIAYPKKSSSVATDLTFESVQQTGLKAGLVDNKICAIDGDWSAVRFVYRLKDRPHRT
jgi:hypothetical protein